MQGNKIKIFLSSGLIIASVLYAIFQDAANPQKLTTIATITPTSEQKPPASSPVPTPAASAPPPKISAVPVAPAATPSPKPKGQYADGNYTGSPADAYYGTGQIEAVIKNGALSDARFLQYPSDRSTSRYISSRAMPILTSEAIQAQNANVDIVSGATFTSQAFQQSLGSALTQAKN